MPPAEDACGPDPRQAGFTLVESLVCLALAALIGMLMIEAVRIAGSASTAAAHASASEEVQSVREHLRRTIGSLARRRADGSRPVLRGGPDGLSAVLEPDRTLERPTEVALTLTRVARADGAYDLAEGRSVADFSPGQANAARGEVLLAHVSGLDIRYFGAQAEGVRPGWHSVWSAPGRRPSLIEIRIAFPATDRRRWPPLLIALDGRL